MKYNRTSRSATVLAALSFSGTAAIAQQQTYSQNVRQFNVVYIMADDLNCDMGSFDDPIVKTPNLDRLRQHAVRFSNAYCQYPLSGPSRASIMTGLYAEQTHVEDIHATTFLRDSIPNVVTLPQLFRNNGYYVARVGKIFHAGVPGDIGRNGKDDPLSWDQVYNPIGLDKTEEHRVINYTPNRNLGSSMSYLNIVASDDELTDGISANVASYLIRKNKQKPFFIALGFYRPHTPYIAPSRYFDMYPLDSITLPYVPKNDWDNKPVWARFNKKLDWGLPELSRREVKRAYYASVSFVDAQIGKILDTLEKEGLTDNTIIVFHSDHGYHLGQHGQWFKQSLYEHVANTPLIISVPGLTKKKAATCNIVEFVDIYPTIATICGLKGIPTHLSGKSLQPVLAEPEKDFGYVAYTSLRRYHKGGKASDADVRGRAIRTSRYRYIEWDNGEKGVELYDYSSDPGEFNNLYGNRKYRKLQEELHLQLQQKVAHVLTRIPN